MTANNLDRAFNISLTSSEKRGAAKRDSIAVQAGIKTNIDPKSYAKVMSARKTDLQELQKILEASSNAILKIIVDYNSQQSEKVLESIARLSSLLMNCLAKLNDKSLERSKRHNHGEAPLPVSSVFPILACPVNSLVFVFFRALFILI